MDKFDVEKYLRLMKIVAFTINPSIDKSTVVDHIVPDNKLRCEKPVFQPGGGGINVSRAIKKVGGDSLAIYLAGGATGDLLTKLIEEEGVKTQVIKQEDRTRENFIVVDSSGQQYRFGMPGTKVTAQECQSITDVFNSIGEEVEYLVLSGSLQEDVPNDIYKEITKTAKSKNINVVLDT